ncbi:acyl-CoA hydrolase [Burkholderia ubonensis]|uniref:Acyl-CoA hydrolase n=1 Tax=Burkholderia ubonensis TaxID=101571 RepID=A0AB74D6W2_9BURK|nr:acyl-CoA hydrolase [Burkholderia ubonensis]PAK01214.1 acyl-CoA hydrolase [Burkholderia ubonensis]RQP28378.1 acyl-CoA hydrolase [Burkholderia ubonensis]RQP36183.1 acyl-CoA hydrolase [Burkholderia ubonensis]RQP39004.1 acyl-CoA hydrolase [Burkholderia ubonensis]
MRAVLDGRRLARFLVQFANVVLSQKPVRAAVGGLAGRVRGPMRFITG